LTPVPHITPKDWAEVVGVNMSAAWRLIRSCAPPLLAAEAGRAVFVTSRIVGQPAAYWGAYGATKAGLEHLILSWADETRTSRLRINLYDPGVVATKLRRAAMPGEDQATLRTPADVAPMLADLCGPAETRHGEVVRQPNR
jgi:NAD(P)-dependent dehydrogenase (short-subunit alcohol dehydrogenase family)